MSKQIKGITWNHSRGYLPMIATSQRYMETHKDVEIIWEKRSLQEFADFPIQELIHKYDLLVIDHPWAGFAACHSDVLVPLNLHLEADYLADQAAHSVGCSHASYQFDGFQSALAIDAAAPVASYRPDLLVRYGLDAPTNWDDLLTLAKKGRVAMPGIPIDSLMNLYMLFVTLGEEPFQSEDEVVSRQMGTIALEQLRELASLCTPEIYNWNPIAVYEAMSTRDDLVYCPFAYGYSNYARPGYARNVILFDDMVSIGKHGRLQSTLGGTGLAISAGTRNLETALDYAKYAADPLTQRTLYVQSGGQPGHRTAWQDDEVNRACGDYFQRTLPALDRAYVRPRYDGYLHFQDHAGDHVQRYIREGGPIDQVLDNINKLYRESLSSGGVK